MTHKQTSRQTHLFSIFKEAESRSDKIESTSNNVQVRKKQQHRKRACDLLASLKRFYWPNTRIPMCLNPGLLMLSTLQGMSSLISQRDQLVFVVIIKFDRSVKRSRSQDQTHSVSKRARSATTNSQRSLSPKRDYPRGTSTVTRPNPTSPIQSEDGRFKL